MTTCTSISHLCAPDVTPGTHSGVCSLCAFEGEGLYDRVSILLDTSTQIANFFPIASPLLCAPCVHLWSDAKKWGRGIYATPGKVLFPLIAAGEAAGEAPGPVTWETPAHAAVAASLAAHPEWERLGVSEVAKILKASTRAVASVHRAPFAEARPLWRDVFRSLDPDTPRALVLTTDPKKRSWPFARVSVGPTAMLLLLDPSRALRETRQVSLASLRSTLDLVERAYAAGFSKAAIEGGLFGAPRVAVQKAGYAETARIEKELAALRRTPEFLPCLIVAQRSMEPEIVAPKKEAVPEPAPAAKPPPTPKPSTPIQIPLL